MNGDPLGRRRAALVAALARRGIRDVRVLAAIGRVPRHEFCLPEDRSLAYYDDVLPIGGGATLSQPLVVASMLAGLALRGNERVLDVGSGSGYTTALLCELAGAVFAVEKSPLLAARAEETLRGLGYENFRQRVGDGWEGWKKHFPYDRILVSAAVPFAPPALLDQLAPDGLLMAPVGAKAAQMLRRFRCDPETGFTVDDLFEVRFVPLERGGERA